MPLNLSPACSVGRGERTDSSRRSRSRDNACRNSWAPSSSNVSSSSTGWMMLILVRGPRNGAALPLALDLVGVVDQLVDQADRLLAGVLLAELMDHRQQLLFIHQREVDIFLVAFQQRDVGGAHVALHPIED